MKTGEWIAFGMLVGMVVCHSAIWFRIWKEHRMAVATAQYAGKPKGFCEKCGELSWKYDAINRVYTCVNDHVWNHPDFEAYDCQKKKNEPLLDIKLETIEKIMQSDCCKKKDEVIKGLAERTAAQSEILSRRAEKKQDEENVVFNTGSKRSASEGRGRYDLLPFEAIRRYALRLQEGAGKYGNRNWEKGQPFSRVIESMIRHAFQYQDGDRSEDHLAAVLFNAGALCHFEREVAEGRLPKELDDMPKRENQ